MALIRTLNFLPGIFQTPTNSQFLDATLDQLVNPPVTEKIQGYVGSKFGYGINANDYYVTEPTKTRTDYQLDPGVVFTKSNTSTAQDFISYPGILDALKMQGSFTDNNNSLFNSQIYSWDSFTNLDKIINFNQYYWLPLGPPAVTVSSGTVLKDQTFIVTSLPNGYSISIEDQIGGSINPTLTLLRGGTYIFRVDQNSKFWIQTEPSVTGYSPINPNVYVRDVFGVNPNGVAVGEVIFQVPEKNAQNIWDYPGDTHFDVAIAKKYGEVSGKLLSEIIADGGLDGVTNIEGLTVIFYDGLDNEVADLGAYDMQEYDMNVPGLSLPYDTDNYTSTVCENFYKVYFYSNPANPLDPFVIFQPDSLIPVNTKLTADSGTQYVNKHFVKNPTGPIKLYPAITAPLDKLYYQDGVDPNKFGVINLIETNLTNALDVEVDILGKKNYTSPNGVKFTNGLKVKFDGDVIPTSYLSGEYYVEGVGTAIQLINTEDLIVPEAFVSNTTVPYSSLPYDIGGYDQELFVPIYKDYITIARNALNLNAWSRSNRWFHIDVIRATAAYNNNPEILTTYGTNENKAQRPIIEFYPNLKLFNSGIVGKKPIDYIDFRMKDAFSQVVNQTQYYPDTEVYSEYTGTLYGVVSGTSTTFEIDADQITGNMQVDQYIQTSSNALPENAYITSITGTKTLTITIAWDSPATIVGGTNLGIVASDIFLANYALFPGSRIVFAVEENKTIQTKIYEVEFSQLVTDGPFVITLTEAPDGEIVVDDQLVVIRGYNYNALDFWYNGIKYVQSQVKTLINQPPLFDVFDKDGISFGDATVYQGTSFRGCKLFSYAIGEGNKDSVLGFPLKYSQIDNVGDISFDVNLNADTFDYVVGVNPITQNVNTGYVYNYSSRLTKTRELGWQTAVGESVQYQLFSFDYNPTVNANFTGTILGNVLTVTSIASGALAPGMIITGTGLRRNQQIVGYKTGTGGVGTYTLSLPQQVLTPIKMIGQTTEVFATPLNSTTTYTVTCDVAPLANTETEWPVLQVYNNNIYLNYTTNTTPDYNEYTIVSTTDNTITLKIGLFVDVKTEIQVLVLSDQVSENAYYTIPVNLSNNPFNENITSLNVGDIRGQYQSIFRNCPNSEGKIFGANNYRDLGNVVPYGNRIIQNSASLVLPGVFLRKQNHNLLNALLFNSREYIKYKTLLVDIVENASFDQRFDPSYMLDYAIEKISSYKDKVQPFFWSDMVPNKAIKVVNTYEFANNFDTSIFPLTKVYNFDTANYNGVLVYINKTVNGINKTEQLIKGIDYTVSSTAPSLTVTKDLVAGDVVIVKEYDQTYGSYAPNTPAKLGLYPATIPAVVLDNTYNQPTWFIVGHDGSYTKLYGEYDAENEILFDFRDQVTFEFEKRIYNNLKLGATVPLRDYEILPGNYKTSPYTYDQWLTMYETNFLDWIGQNRIDYKTQYYNITDQYSYNYRDSSSEKITNNVILQGYWRGINQYFFGTTTPNLYPWQMLGYANQPDWWTTKYGPAPYTSGNLLMWQDIFDGIDYNNGNPITIKSLRRSTAERNTTAWTEEFNTFMNILPVGTGGELLSPINSVVGNYNIKTLRKDWIPGDMAPAELAYRRSSTWPFDLMRLFALTKPAKFFNLGVDLDNYRYNYEFNQFLVNDRSHLVIDNIEIYGEGTAKTSYINWIVDYEKQLGAGATQNIKDLLFNLDVRLVYRLAGFSDKTTLKFYVEKGTPNSRNASLLIPDESYALLLYDNQPSEKLIYSSVIVQVLDKGYAVYGNSQTSAYFKTLTPKYTGKFETLQVDGVSVRVTTQFTNEEQIIPYGTKFYTPTELCQFLLSYGAWLTSKGAQFDTLQNGVELNWTTMCLEFLYWLQMGFQVGSIMTLNPAASILKLNKESLVVQPLTIHQQNFVLNQNLYPIAMKDLSVVRTGTEFTVEPQNEGDSLSYGQFNFSNFEHAVVFNNVTLFDDVIYNLQTGLRQNRIFLRGTKTADWNGTIYASGFIINQDNIQEWDKGTLYTKGSIVKFKNKYWTALKIVQPNNTFQEKEWKETDYNEIQKGLLPNSSTRSYESTLYYNVDAANLEQDADLLSFSLIGYRPRDYLALADLTDITQVNVYKNMIKEKGTRNSVSAFKGARLPQGGIDYEVYENWAIKQGSYGGLYNNNFIEFKLNQPLLTSNPFTVALTDGTYVPGIQQEVPIYNLYNYSKVINDPNVLPTLSQYTPSTLLPDAGYANYDDVKMMAYFMPQLAAAVNKYGLLVTLPSVYVNDYIWVANVLGKWQIFTPSSIGQVIAASYNLDSTSTITFAEPHNLELYDIFAIVGFNTQVDGYYTVEAVLSPTQVVVALTFQANNRIINGIGVALQFNSQRVDTPADINSLDLTATEFVKNTVWVDENSDGGWAVYRKSINYNYETQLYNYPNSVKFGTAVAYTDSSGYLISDPQAEASAGKVYRYRYNGLLGQYLVDETLTGDLSFGTRITHQQNLYAISTPENNPSVKIYAINNSQYSDNLIELQTITNTDDENFGIGLEMSGDTNWLYVSNFDEGDPTAKNNVHVYRKQNVPTDAGSFVSGEVYQITSLGTEVHATDIVIGQTYQILFAGNTDFTLIGAPNNNYETVFVATGTGTGTGVCLLDPTNFTVIGAVENKVGIYFVATGSGSGTGTANLCSYEYVNTISSGETSIDKFGYSIATNYYGDTVVIGAPYKGVTDHEKWGKSYIYSRSVQTYEAQANSPVSFALTWTPALGSQLFVTRNGSLVDNTNYSYTGSTFTYSGTCLPGDIINVSGNEFTLVQIVTTQSEPATGTQFGNSVDTNKFATEVLIGAPFALTSVSQEGAIYRYTNGGSNYGIVVGTNECNVTTPKTLLINGYPVTVTGNASSVATAIKNAEITNVTATANNNILTISIISADLAIPNQKLVLTSNDYTIWTELGINVYTQTQVITCPHQTGPTQFGTVVKFNETSSFVTSAPVGTCYEQTTFDFTDDANYDNDTIFDNNATQFVESYPNAGAVYMFDYLGVYNENVNNPGQFVYAQSCNDKHLDGSVEFEGLINGDTLEVTKIMIGDIVIGQTISGLNVKPNTKIIDFVSGEGGLGTYTVSVSQNVPATAMLGTGITGTLFNTYGSQPLYGTALDFSNNKVVIGTPNYRPEDIDGKVVSYINLSGIQDWSVYRQSAPIVDINKIQNIQLFSAETNNTLINLDYFDPLQGKMLGAVRENIDIISNSDPASYNIGSAGNNFGKAWGAAQEGTVWFDTTNVRFVNYHQNDALYNAQYWGTLFPGSDVAVYTWVASNNVPSSYVGPGTVYDPAKFAVQTMTDSTNVVKPVYYFWVRNTGVIFNNKQLADVTIANYIRNPVRTGISYLTPLLPNAVAVYNGLQYVNANDTVLHIGYGGGVSDDPAHNEYTLIRSNYAEDFLPGVPEINSNQYPESLYDRMLDSLSGCDELGQVVPNPLLPKAVQSGILARPRQSFFYNRYKALENYLTYANTICSQYPITEIRNTQFLNKSGEYYNVQDYWELVNYWVAPYSDSTKAAFQVPLYSDLLATNPPAGTIATVKQNGQGLQETYIYEYNEVTNTYYWTRIGLQNGTIKFKSSLWDYSSARLGFGDNFFDTDTFDLYPSEETRWIIRSLNEEIYTNELLIHRNKSLILLFDYIQSETIDNQNYLPWLNKTSLADVNHKIRELLPYEVYRSDNQDFLAGYINEVKPYHVVVKDFLFTYTGQETFEGDVTDFDLPAQFSTINNQFISPELVYTPPTIDQEFLPTNTIWQNPEYTQWFDNKGLSFTGQNDYKISKLLNYLTPSTTEIAVENVSGFPVNGVITIGTEQIAYSAIDRENNLLQNLGRGYNDTTATVHLPGAQIYIDLPPVVVINGGSQYDPGKPPAVNVIYDTALYGEPAVAAQFTVNIGLDNVTSVEVTNPGQGYMVTPEIEIDPSLSIIFNSTNINIVSKTITLITPILKTGDEIRFKQGTSSIPGLVNNNWYYVGVIQNSPTVVIALYTDYNDAVKDINRVNIKGTGTGTGHSLNLGAKVYPIMTSLPVRENTITLRYDRTTYGTQVTDWVSGAFYAGSFNGECPSTEAASSSFTLEQAQPPISSILASADGYVLQINNVSNELLTEYSAFKRRIGAIVPGNLIQLNPYGPVDINASGSTIGFTVGMPIKFVGDVGISGIVANTEYYVKEIVSSIEFTISDTVGGSVKTLTDCTFTTNQLGAYTAKVSDTTLLDVFYSGIRTVTATQQNSNLITIPVTALGTGGTQGFYVDMLVEFVGNVFGGIEDNGVYYVTTVADNEHFTISKTPNPTMFTLNSTLPDDIITLTSSVGLAVNEPIIFNNFIISAPSISNGLLCTISEPGNTDFTLIGAPNSFKGTTFVATGAATGTGQVTTNNFGGIVSGKLYYVQSLVTTTQIKISETLGGSVVPLTVVNYDGLDGSSGLMTSQAKTLSLTNATGAMTVNVCMPISQGQINKQQFTLYPTSKEYVDVVGITSNKITGTVAGVIADGNNRLAISDEGNNLANLYENMPVEFAQNIGGDFTAGTTYYIKDLGITEFIVTQTFSTGNYLETTDASILYVGMPLVFTNYGLGGIVVETTYFVTSVNTITNQFTVSLSLGGFDYVVSSETGSMTATGQKYFTLSATQGGSELPVTTTTPVDVDFTQVLLGFDPMFNINWMLGAYNVLINPDYPGSGYAINNVITIKGTEFADAGGISTKNDITITVDAVDSTGQITNIIVEGTPPETINKYYLKVVDADTVAVYSDPFCTIPVPSTEFNYTGVSQSTITNISNTVITLQDASSFDVNDRVIFTAFGDLSLNIVEGVSYFIVTISGNDITISQSAGGTPIDNGTPTITGTGPTIAKSGSFAFLQQPFYFDPSIVKWNGQVWKCVVSNHDTGSAPTLGKWELLNSDNPILNAMDRVKGYYDPTPDMPGVDLSQLFEGVQYPNSIYYGKSFSPVPDYAIDTILRDQVFYPTDINSVAVTYTGTNYIVPANLPTYSAFLLDGAVNNWDIATLANKPLGLSDIVFDGENYVMTSTNSATPIFRSNNGVTWSTNGYFTPFDYGGYDELNYDITSLNVSALSLSSVAYGTIGSTSVFVAVGKNIVSSIDTYSWNETYVFSPTATIYNFNTVSYIDCAGYTGFIAGGIVDGQTILVSSVDGYNWVSVPITSSKAVNGIATDGTTIVAVCDDGYIYTSTDSVTWTLSVYTAPDTLRDIHYANGIFMAVGEQGTCITSTDGSTWTQQSTGVLRTLNGLIFASTVDGNIWTVVGEQNTILQSDDNGVTWNSQNVFNVEEPVYTVQGDPFVAGYGPEELVPGVLSDNLAMIVTTAPGTTWPGPEYGHTGYNVVSKEFTPTSSTDLTFTFEGIVYTPAQLALFQINKTTGLSTTLYQDIDYTVDWLAGTVTLLGTNPLNFVAYNNTDTLRMDVYEVGNGSQLQKSDTLSNPIFANVATGFSEIYLSCNYSAPAYNGGGVVISDSYQVETTATQTYSGSNYIKVDDISQFILNDQIYFAGSVFGNVSIGTSYYVKYINTADSTITISDAISGGVAGPVFNLTDATGSMIVEITNGAGTTYTDPIVYVNGTKQTLGHMITVSRTQSYNNSIVCNSTDGFYPNEPITFSETIFDGNIAPLTTYYVRSIISSNTFDISLTPGGSAIVLGDNIGSATALSNDYAVGLIPQSTKAKLVFANQYDTDNDFITYTLFGQTTPVQFGYTIPETQVIVADGANTVFTLTNYVGGTNAENAIVEIDGQRKDQTEYTIDSANNTVTFTFTPSANANIGITSFNDTNQQYLNTQNISNVAVANIITIDNTITTPIASTSVTATTSIGNVITATSTAGFLAGQTIEFKGVVTIGNILIDGTVYFVSNVINSTDFTICINPADVGNVSAEFNPGTGIGLINAYVGGVPAVRVETGIAHGFTSPDNGNVKVRLDGIVGSAQLNDNSYYVHVISDTMFDLYEQPYQVNGSNSPITSVSTYVSGGFVWNDQTFMIYDTTANAVLANEITVADTDILVVGTPAYFTEIGVAAGDATTIPEIIAGQRYYIKSLDGGSSIITISETYEGPTLALTVPGGSFELMVSQWLQTNIDRLWVTINGYRVPSTSLKLGADNQLNILHVVDVADTVLITSMIPTATPNSIKYVNLVNQSNEGTVYRVNTLSQTYLTESLGDLDTTIYVNDASRLSATVVQNVTVPAIDNGKYYIGLNVDKTSIQNITVYNNTTSQTITSGYYDIEIISMSPTLVITGGAFITTGDQLTITMTEGKLIYINGEQIIVGTVDLENNTLTDLIRGANGTGIQTLIPAYAPVLGLLSQNQMSDINYHKTWNPIPGIYNTELGDPLQISNTSSANFLKSDVP